MNKTSISLIPLRGWISSIVRPNMYGKLVGLLLFFGSTQSTAQGIKCTDVNAGIDVAGNIFVSIETFVYDDCRDSLKYAVFNPYGGVVQISDASDCKDVISFNACAIHEQTYKVRFGDASDSCWADLTFHKQDDNPCTAGSLNCSGVNAGIDEFGNISVLVGEFVTNCADSIKYTVYNPFGGLVQSKEFAACSDAISFKACSALSQTYKVCFENANDSCWSDLTFHKATSGNCVIRWPNCSNVNAELDADGSISVLVGEFVTNCRDSIDYTVYNPEGGVVVSVSSADCADVISFNGCAAVGQTYNVHFVNGSRDCWSDLTFKPSPCGGPLKNWNKVEKKKRKPMLPRVRQG